MPSEISSEVPDGCKISFAQVLARHGARDPTSSKTAVYANLIGRVHSSVSSYPGRFAFLANYSYTLGADQLTPFGQQQMFNLGIEFFNRYHNPAEQFAPFIRTTDEDRVLESGENFTQGFYQTCTADKSSHSCGNLPYPIVEISEDPGSNNTLDHGLCTSFEDGIYSDIGSNAQAMWTNIFVPPITDRLNANLKGANFSAIETVYMMDLCPFNTIASLSGQLSPFCNLFSEAEWRQYDYFQSLGKYYGFGKGNPLGPTQGVGFTNELIARLTGMPVQDHTSVNHTLDDSNVTFPVGRGHPLFADFSHDK